MIKTGFPNQDEVVSTIRTHLRMHNVTEPWDFVVETDKNGNYRCTMREPTGIGAMFESRHEATSRAGVLSWAAFAASEIHRLKRMGTAEREAVRAANDEPYGWAWVPDGGE